jgi:hypothetical protein
MSDLSKMLEGMFGKTMMFTERPKIIDEFANAGNFRYTDDDGKVMEYLAQFFDYELFRGRATEAVKWEGQHPAFKQTYFKVHGRSFEPAAFLHYVLYAWGNANVEIIYHRQTRTFHKRIKNEIIIAENYELAELAYNACREYMASDTEEGVYKDPRAFIDGFKAAHKQQQ